MATQVFVLQVVLKTKNICFKIKKSLKIKDNIQYSPFPLINPGTKIMKIRVVSLDFAICPIITAIFKPKNVICVNNDEIYIRNKTPLFDGITSQILISKHYHCKKQSRKKIYILVYPFILCSFEIFKLLLKVAFQIKAFKFI